MRAVHSIDHFALNVPSLEQARYFFNTFGLEVLDGQDRLQLRASDQHVWAHILPARTKSLAYLSFNCFEDDYETLRIQAAHIGAAFEEGDGEGFWFRDPDGNLLQVKVGSKYMPNAPMVLPPAAHRLRGAGTRGEAPQVRPRRLSHVLFFSPQVSRAVEFYETALGLKLSEHSQDIIAFTHAPHGCDHHLVAFTTTSTRLAVASFALTG